MNDYQLLSRRGRSEYVTQRARSGERVTVPQRRTGWLDRELDYETAPGHVRHKLYDLDHRKYDGATAQFLSVDPLWPMFISSGSYVYCTGGAINNVDPWGLGPDNPLAPTPRPKQSPKPEPSSLIILPMVTGHDESTTETNRLEALALLRDQFQISAMIYSLMRNKEQMLSGISPGGKGGVGYWSGRGATPETAVQLKGVTVSATRIRGFSLAEMYAHFQIGGGEEMVIDMATIDLTGTTQRELGIDGMIAGEDREVNLFNAGSLNPSALAFGRVRMKYHGNNQFSILAGEGANFNFSPLIDPQASLARNAGNVLGALINYNIFLTPFSRILPFVPLLFGGGYDVGFVGTTYISR
jgi:RHS repeat-associated protein